MRLDGIHYVDRAISRQGVSMPRPEQEVIDKLKTLYIQKDMVWKQLDGILNMIGTLLKQQEDYARWLDGDGLESNLPSWIHEITGGRPYGLGIKSPVERRPKPEKKETREKKVASSLISNLMKGFK